ncbi:hypothetical protein OQA88_7735 [Cercophora sp. LCS_1]
MSALLLTLRFDQGVSTGGGGLSDDCYLPLDINNYTFDKSDCPLQDAFTFFPKVQGKDVPARLKTFLYGDGSPQGSGFWNGLRGRTQPVLDAIAAAELGLFNDILTCVVGLAKLLTQSPGTSSSHLKAVNDAIKKTLRACLSVLAANTGTAPIALQRIKEFDPVSMQASVNNQIFTDWAHAFDSFLWYGQWLRPHQDKLNQVYEKSGRKMWFNKSGYPPFEFPDCTPRAVHYQLKEPLGLNHYLNPVHWHWTLWGMARNQHVYVENFTASSEDRMDQFLADKQPLGDDKVLFQLQQYMLATEMKRVDIASSSALDLTIRLRNARRLGRCILQTVQSWQDGYVSNMDQPLAVLQVALWKLYGNLFSADGDEISLNWAELYQACQNYASASETFKSIQGSRFEGELNKGIIDWLDSDGGAADANGVWIYGDGVDLDNQFYQIMGAQLDGNKDLVA